MRALGDPDFHEVLDVTQPPTSTRHVLVHIADGPVILPLVDAFQNTDPLTHELDLTTI